MADIDLNALSLDELKKLQKKVKKAVDGYEDKRRKEARSEVEAKAREFGFSLSDFVDGSDTSGKKKREPQPAKYRHPENESLTWSGRGRQPQWIKEALENGTSLDSFLIEPAS